MTDRHGCYNRMPFKEAYMAQHGWSFSGMAIRSLIKHNMSRDCRHPERATDPRCAGCKWVTMTDEEVRAQLASK